MINGKKFNEDVALMQKLQCRRLYTLSKKAPTKEEREAAKQEYLELVGKVRANAILG